MDNRDFYLAIARYITKTPGNTMANDAYVENPDGWITMNGNHIPVAKGQTPKEAGEAFLKDKNNKAISGSEYVKQVVKNNPISTEPKAKEDYKQKIKRSKDAEKELSMKWNMLLAEKARLLNQGKSESSAEVNKINEKIRSVSREHESISSKTAQAILNSKYQGKVPDNIYISRGNIIIGGNKEKSKEMFDNHIKSIESALAGRNLNYKGEQSINDGSSNKERVYTFNDGNNEYELRINYQTPENGSIGNNYFIDHGYINKNGKYLDSVFSSNSDKSKYASYNTEESTRTFNADKFLKDVPKTYEEQLTKLEKNLSKILQKERKASQVKK